MSSLVSRLEAAVFLQLLFLLKPDTVDKFMIGPTSPNVHRLLLELVRSAKHEDFLSFLKFTVSQTKPSDEINLVECLFEAFWETTKKDQLMLLDRTDHSQLRAFWLENKAHERVIDLIKSSTSKMPQLLKLCSNEV